MSSSRQSTQTDTYLTSHLVAQPADRYRRLSTSSSTTTTSSTRSQRPQTSLEHRLSLQHDPREYSSFFDIPATSTDSSPPNSQRHSRDHQHLPNVQPRPHRLRTSHDTSHHVLGHTRRPPRPVRRSAFVESPTLARTFRRKPGETFKMLPNEILSLIFDCLRDLHLRDTNGKSTCSTCWTRDICSLAQVNKQCSRSAQIKLYENIWIEGIDSSTYLKRMKSKPGTKLKMLKSALASNPKLAATVRELKVPELSGDANKEERDKYLDLVISVIVICPNLERFFGLDADYNHQYCRLAHALQSRTKLTERVWQISMTRPPPPTKRWSWTSKSAPQSTMSNSLTLGDEQSKNFICQHENWHNLKTLVIRCANGGNIDPRTINASLERLPSLRALALFDIPRLSTSLLCNFPALQSLHLHNSTTLTTQALSTFAASPQAKHLKSLSLIHVSVTSLPILARLFSHLTSLRKLVFIQDQSPLLPVGTSIYLHPYFASTTLEELTWDILNPAADLAADATFLLAKSMEARGFPTLERIRAPCDYHGHIQAQCRPILNAAMPVSHDSQASYNTIPSPLSLSKSLSVLPRHDSGISISTTMYTRKPAVEPVTLPVPTITRSLTQATKSASERASNFHHDSPNHHTVHISDHSDITRPITIATFDFPAVLGRIGTDCKIIYDTTPDYSSGVERDICGITFSDFMAGRKERGDEANICEGRWSRRKEGLHAPRINHVPLSVSSLF